MEQPSDYEVSDLVMFMHAYDIHEPVPGYRHLRREDIEARLAEIKLREAQAKEARAQQAEAQQAEAGEAAAREARAKEAAEKAAASRRAAHKVAGPKPVLCNAPTAFVPGAASPPPSVASHPAPSVAIQAPVAAPAVTTLVIAASPVVLPTVTAPARAPSSAPLGTLGPAVARRKPPRLRVFFLRHFRNSGEVRLAAARTGLALSTLYRWRARDPAFRARWDDLALQRRDTAEDRLMAFVRDGERTAVFYKGVQVGWRQSHTARAAIAALAYFDRRDRILAGNRKDLRDSVSRSGTESNGESFDESAAWVGTGSRKTGTAGSLGSAHQ